MAKIDYNDKFLKIIPKGFDLLPHASRELVLNFAHHYQLTSSELKRVTECALDLKSWDIPLSLSISSEENEKPTREEKGRALLEFFTKMEELKLKRSYDFTPVKVKESKIKGVKLLSDQSAKILGRCPVASESTLCCNLITLDSVRNCAFECSYCSIQVFNGKEDLIIDTEFKDKLNSLTIKSDEIYHIGTGQASDSLLSGNRSGHLDALIEFARKNPNVILELKSKSRDIRAIKRVDLPKNIISTWSLNPQRVIDHEEHLTASLAERISSAKAIHDQGNLVGFHFHPIFYYENYKIDYEKIITELIGSFDPSKVACVSLGALTYTNKVMNEIRRGERRTKVFQMPLVEIAGKYSYPLPLKAEIFKTAYDAFAPWHGKVFFYLCMEDRSLWKPLFNHEYETNLHFESAMKNSYMEKIRGASSLERIFS